MADGTERMALIERAVDVWTGQLVDLGGRNTLLYFKDLKAGTLDLGGEQVSESARWRVLGSHTVRLSDLVAPEALPDTAKRARTIRAKATENFEERGLRTLFLAWGMASWTNQIGTAAPAAPVLLRQATLTPRGGAGEDFDLSLPDEFEINPTLVHFLFDQFQVRIDADELLALIVDDAAGTPDAEPVFERLREVGVDVGGFDVAPRVVLGNFSYAKLPMVKDLEAALAGGAIGGHDLLAAVAGHGPAREAVKARHPVISIDLPDQTPPADEFLVLDADASQNYAINAAIRGSDLVVEGPPGTGKSQTIANLIATMSARGKRTLFVAEKRAAIDAVLERLAGVGLGDLVLDLHDGVASRRRVAQDLARSLAAAGAVPLTDHADADAQLQRRRDTLRSWRDTLHTPRDPWGISVYEIQAELTGLRATESTAVRLDRSALLQLGGEAYRAAHDEVDDFVDRGGLALLTGGDPWLGAFRARTIVSPDQVQLAADALAAATDQAVPTTRAELHRLAAGCGLRSPTSAAEGEALLSLVEGVVATLASYQPALFDDADALLVALAPGARGLVGRIAAVVGNPAYRRAKKRMVELAGGRKDPARSMHATAVAAADQRRRWAALGLTGAGPGPTVTDPAPVRQWFAYLGAQLTQLAALTGDPSLTHLSFDDLAAWLAALRGAQATLVKLPELVRLGVALEHRGLIPFVEDAVRNRASPASALRALRYVWLASLYDHVCLTDPAVGAFDRAAHDRAVDEFRAADTRHLADTPARVRRAVAERVVATRDAHEDQSTFVAAEAAKKQRHRPIRELVQAAPDVLTALKPCWAMSPLVVAQLLPAERLFDLVIFDEASQVTPADAVGALLRGERALVAGDSKQLPPTNFFAATFGGGEDDEALEEALFRDAEGPGAVSLTTDIESVLHVMRALLPPPVGTKTLAWHYRSRDERLIAFSNAQEALYDWSLTTFPGTGIDDCMRHELVPWEQGRVGQEESVAEEVERVVELIVEHAEQRPGESLGVIAMGIKHANRIAERLRQVRRERPDLDAYFDQGPPGRTRPEPLFIKNLERVQGDERDAILLTIGYGKTADGRLMYRFGPLNMEGGERRLNVAVTRARNRMTVVSSFSSQDMDPNKLRAEGARMLCRYLQYAESKGAQLGDQAMVKPELNPFERDVRDALTARGVPLVAQYGCSGYWIDFAAAHPTQPGRMVLALEADGATYHSGATTRDRDRLRQNHLERLGWQFHRIWSTDWFHHRDQEIDRAVQAWEAAVGHADGSGGRAAAAPAPLVAAAPPAPAVAPVRTLPKPRLRTGQPIDDYSPDQLVQLIRWIESDTLLRTEDELLAEAMAELGFRRRGTKIVATLDAAIAAARATRR